MLAGTQADIVFLVDKSSSEGEVNAQPWLAALISGDVNGDGDNTDPDDTLSLTQQLSSVGIDDVRYGLVGFGETENQQPFDHRYAHSQLFDFTTGDPDSLFGDPTSATQSGPNDPLVDTGDLNAIFDANLAQLGGQEDGWDAIEHAIAEYEIRDGAVPVFVLVQNDGGRIDLNDTLTRPGVLAALASKNAILDVMVTGLATRDSAGTPVSREPLYTIAGAGVNERVLGVEADEAGGPVDMLHNYHSFDTVTHVETIGQFDDTPSSLDTINGETTTQIFNGLPIGGETEDSYVRLAWDTGGAAWDASIIGGFASEIDPGTGQPYGFSSPEANALRDAFIDSLGDQILRAEAVGKVFRTDDVLLSLNLGGISDVDAGTAGLFRADDGTYATSGGDTFSVSSTPINVSATNSIPTGDATALKQVFAAGRGERFSDSTDENISLDIHSLDVGGTITPLENGTYTVELFFAEIDPDIGGLFGDRTLFDVKLEGETMLADYSIANDRTRITNFGSSNAELDSAKAGVFTGYVKRYQIDVSGGDGLQIELERKASGAFDPLLSAVRILDNGPPRIEDVIISGSNSVHDAYSFSEAFSQGIHEFQTVPVGGADTIEIVFSEWVDVEASDIVLVGGHTQTWYHTAWNIVDFAFDDETFTARWRFDDPADSDSLADPLPADEYLIRLGAYSATVIHDIAGNMLDGDWATPLGLGSPSPTSFPSGQGNEGGMFNFTFVLLPGDHDLDNSVAGSAFLWWQTHYDPNGTDNTFTDGDFDGDGDVDSEDLALWEANYGLNLTDFPLSLWLRR